MGGLRRLMPRTYVGNADRRARARGDPAVLRASSPRTRSSRRRSDARLVGYAAVRRPGVCRRVPHRPLHVPDAVRRLLRRAVRRSCRSTSTRGTATAGRWSMLAGDASRCWPSSPAFGGWLPVRRRLDADLRLARTGRRAARRGERDGGGDREHLRRRRRSRRHRRRLVDLLGAPRRSAPRPVRPCSSTSSTSTSCTTGSSTGRRSHLATSLDWVVEGPVVSGSIVGVAG